MPLVIPNPVVDTTWRLLVPEGSDFLMTLPYRSTVGIELATMEAETPPVDPEDSVVFGHRVGPDGSQGMTRALIGPGYVYARTRFDSAVIALSVWT